MDYYKNVDHFCHNTESRTAKAVEYHVLEDLLTEPIGIIEVKEHLRVDYNNDDNLIKLYITAARQYLERYTQRSFGVKRFSFQALSIPDNYKLMYGPINEVFDRDNFGDTIINGGDRVSFEFTTKDTLINDNIRNAIAMEAANRYMIREGIPLNDNGTSPGKLENLAKELVNSYRNLII